MLYNLGGKRRHEIFWVLTLQNFHVKSNILVGESPGNFHIRPYTMIVHKNTKLQIFKIYRFSSLFLSFLSMEII